MKKHFLNRIISMVLVIVTLVGVFSGAAVALFAADTNEKAELKADVHASSDEIIKEAESRKGPTSDRSQIPEGAHAGVYLNGVLVDSGEFSRMWNKAMSLAPDIDSTHTQISIEKMDTVEYVLNMSMYYDKTWFGEGTMTITGKKFTIDLNGNNIYRVDQAGTVIMVDEYSSVTIMDSNPNATNTSHLTEDFIKESGFPWPDIKGGIIGGGYHSTRNGGGIYIDDGSTVYLLGGTVCANKADHGSGVCIENNSTLDMRGGNAQICYNYSAGTSSDGGAVYLGSGCRVYGGSVHHNLADDHGGGIRADGGDILISDVTIYNNRALELGGGIYITRTYKGQTVSVDGCKIVNNYADEEGGGIYIYNLKLAKLNNCIIQDNAACKEGAGVFLCDDIGTDLQISGNMVIRNNFVAAIDEKTSDYRSNLYLEGDDDLIASSLGVNSEVWIRIEEDIDDYMGISCPITVEPTDNSHLLFFSDVDGYYIARQNDPTQENFRYLYFEKGSRNTNLVKNLNDYETKILDFKYEVQSRHYQDITTDIYRGYVQYRISSSDSLIPATPFYYSDGYFLDDPEVYNDHLATMSANVALAAAGICSDAVPGNEYATHFANVKQLFADIGCADENFFVNEAYQNEPEFYGEDEKISTIGVAISMKEIKVMDETFILLPVAIRGGGYGAEWASNALLGDRGEAKGFSDAAKTVCENINEYISSKGLSKMAERGLVKFWVVGYSRGGATANLTSKRLVDHYGKKGNDVYGYTFEAPRGGIESKKLDEEYTGGGTYPTIHNIINENDLITHIGPIEMGFIRYGKDHLIASDHANGNHVSYNPDSSYYIQRQKMVAQLNAINPYLCFNDYWEIADVNIIFSRIPLVGTDLIDKGEQPWDDPNPECRDPQTFVKWFIQQVVEHALGLKENGDARLAYSKNKPLTKITTNMNTNIPYYKADYNFAYSEYTLEQAVSGMLYIMFTLPDAKMDKFMDVILGNANEYIGNIFNIFGIFSVYLDAIYDWDGTENEERAELINDIMHVMLNGSNESPYFWELLSNEQAEIIAESLPVLLYSIIEYASEDYKISSVDDDGMWGIGTFINNMNYILTNHYEEVTLAWLRSYDSYYTNDLEASTIVKKNAEAPVADIKSIPGKVILSAEKGSPIFYTIDGGKTWQLYTSPFDAPKATQTIEAFSVSRGTKSKVIDVQTNRLIGFILSEHSSIWIIISVGLVVVGVAVVVIIRRKKTKF